MERNKIPAAAIIIILALGFWILLTGYGNTKNHPTLNTFIVKHFTAKNNKGGFSMSKFKNYEFGFDRVKLKGNFITEPGLFNPSEIDRFHEELAFWASEKIYGKATFTEELREKTPMEWISHGGFSADVPEVPASLRHFYDPTRPAGKRYLTDDVNGKLLSWIQSKFRNPETDGVEWALGQAGSFGALEHNYTWENGKQFMKGALEETDPAKRREMMARVWRSLGETLHMIADNGLPSHVRNDAHPSVPVPLMSYFGNPDTYEEMMDDFQKNDNSALDKFLAGSIDPAFVSRLEKATTVNELAHELARFTNENFFTGETISGKDWKGNEIKPIAHPEYVYASPKISSVNYSDNYYRKKVAGQEVLLCTDTWFFSDYPVSKTYPYLDKKCVESNARVLVPAIRETGMHAMKLFIPALSVRITSLADDGTITGEVVHLPDKEYKQQIRYNGPVLIKTATLDELGNLMAKNGKFSGKIRMEENAVINAEIEFGGITVKSDQKTIKAAPKKVAAPAAANFNIHFRISVHATYTAGYRDQDQSFPRSDYFVYESPNFGTMYGGFEISRGGTFSGRISSPSREATIEGQRSDDRIIHMTVRMHEKWRRGQNDPPYREEWTDIELRNIPLASDGKGEYGIRYHRDGWDCVKLQPDPEFSNSIMKLEHRVKFYPSNEEISLLDINYSKSEHEACKNWQNLMFPRSYITVSVSYNNNR